MKEKTLLAVHLPAVNNSYDFLIPNEFSIKDTTQFVANLLEEKEKRRFKADVTTSLYLKSDGSELDVNKLVGECNFVDGTELVLI